MNLQRSYLADFISLLFPQLCQACGQSLLVNEKLICLDCRYNLPFTNFHLQPDNIVARQFWGKINIEAAYALYYFTKGGKIQHLMHQFKYKGIQEIGNLLGNIAGEQLKVSSVFNAVDLIIPVPLHKKRLKERGYNQSACFARGLAEKLNIEVELENLIRSKGTSTQTNLNRFARFENMQQVFEVLKPERLINKHVLLVDDIITTGSTLEACALPLMSIAGLKLSIATIAYAE